MSVKLTKQLKEAAKLVGHRVHATSLNEAFQRCGRALAIELDTAGIWLHLDDGMGRLLMGCWEFEMEEPLKPPRAHQWVIPVDVPDPVPDGQPWPRDLTVEVDLQGRAIVCRHCRIQRGPGSALVDCEETEFARYRSGL